MKRKIFYLLLCLCIMIMAISSAAFALETESATTLQTESSNSTFDFWALPMESNNSSGYSLSSLSEGFSLSSSTAKPAPGEVSTWEELQNAMTNGNSAILMADIKCPAGGSGLVLPAGKIFTLDLNGHTIDRGLTEATENGYVIQVNSSLSIKDTSPTGLGKITGGNNTDGGGGIDCVSGTVILTGGSICGNKAAYGGGICVKAASSTVCLNGGTICHNTVTGNGGGIWTSVDCHSVTFGDPDDSYDEFPGTVVSDNVALGSGGGFYGACQLLMHRGAFKNNTAYVNGGAICYSFEYSLSSNTLIRLWDYNAPVEITGNRAGSNGGGVYLYERSYTPHLYFCIGNKVTLKDNTDLTGTQMSNAFLGDGIGLYIVGYNDNYLSPDSEVHISDADIPLRSIAITGAVEEGFLDYNNYPQIKFDEPKADAFPVVYFGTNTDPIAWYLLPQTNHEEGNAHFLWSKSSVGEQKFESVDKSVMAGMEVPDILKESGLGAMANLWDYMSLVFGNNTKHTWWNSTARVWLNGDFYNNAFSAQEKTGILQTKVTNFHTVMEYDGCAVDDKVFLLSAEELVSTKYGFIDNLTTMGYSSHRDDAKAGNTVFMMRTPYGTATGTEAVPGIISASGTFYENPGLIWAIQEELPLRPGINMDKDDVPFFLPAVNAQKDSVGNQLSAVDSENSALKVALVSEQMIGFVVNYRTTGSIGVINFNYSNGTVGENNYISAVVLDELGTVKYMGNLAKAKTTDNLSIDLTNLNLKDSDRLYVYCSQENGDYKTNYCSYPREIELPHSHEMTVLKITDATCIAQGISVDCFYCADCGKYFADENGNTVLSNAITAPLGHSWTTEYTMENSDAVRHYLVCTRCDVKDEGAEHDSPTGCSVCGKATNEMSRIRAVFQSGGTVKLNQDIVFAAGENPFTADGVSVVLDLNGHTIDRNGANAPDYYSETFIVKNGGSLTIKDSSPAQTGKITGSTGNGINKQYGLSVISVQKGTLNLEGGSISDNGRTAIMVSYTSVLNMSGGTISNNRSSVSGGGINAQLSSSGGAIINITGGTISNNYAADNGGGICGNGGTNGKGTMTLSGATITNNTAGNCGGGVYYGGSANAKLTIKNTSITGNSIRSARNTTTYGTGYGIGGGLCLCGLTVPELSGEVIVKDNYAGIATNKSNVDDVYQTNGALLKVNGVLTGGSSLSAEAGNYLFASCDEGKASANMNMFHSDDCDTVDVLGDNIVLRDGNCTYGNDFGADDTNHYKICTKCKSFCTDNLELYDRHTGGTATCTEKKICTTCGYSYDEPLGHTGGTATCTEQAVCERCNQSYGDLLPHSGGTATCTQQAVCDNCGQFYGKLDPANHTSVEDDGNCTTDILCADCGELVTEGEPSHTGGTATCADYAKCVVCGLGYGVLADHTWTAANCENPKTCSDCGATEGYALGHDWGIATCTEPETCKTCGDTRGEALGHDWEDADCDTPKTCSVCGETEGEAAGHKWSDADCEHPKTCSVCGDTEGEALGHSWVDADCETPKTCSACGATEGEAAGHKWTDADCEHPKTCSVCGETEGEALGHSWVDADCETPKTCSVCGETEGEAAGHKWTDADCNTPKTCSVCGETEGEAAGHKWTDADCENPKTCSVCNKTEGEAAGHKWTDADCDTPKTCSVCNKTEGDAAGHKWSAADCNSPRTCTVCGSIDGAPLGHSWVAADCDTPKTCSVCGETEGEAAGHKWTDADCNTPKTCSACGATEGNAIGHSWVAADCNNPKTCDRCKVTEGAPLGHDWKDADCDTPKTCSVCGETEGTALGHSGGTATCKEQAVCERCKQPYGDLKDHSWVDADCDTPKTCSACGATEGEAAGHKWTDADCEHPKTCSACGATEGEAAGHKWTDADCEHPKTCSVCGETEGEAAGHKWTDADCNTPKTCSACGATEGEAAGHKWSETYSFDENGHYHVCSVCDAEDAVEAHIPGPDATATTAQTCTKCDYIFVEALGHPVTFVMNGYGTAMDAIYVADGGTINKPVDPVETGYIFGGWYKESALENLWDFDTDTVTSATILYAKWTEDVPVHECDKCDVCGYCLDLDCDVPECSDKCLLLTMNFTDLDTNLWYMESITYAYHHGLLVGVGDNLFDPTGITTREMIATIIWRMEGSPVVGGEMPFTDVPEGEWYSEAVKWAASKEFMLGYGDDLFGFNDPITREQMAALLCRYAEYKNMDVSVPEDIDLSVFTDADLINDYAVSPMEWAYHSGLIIGRGNGLLAPLSEASRSEVAEIFMRFCQMEK